MKNIYQLLTACILSLLAYSCANIQPLGGGPREKDAPILEYSLPKSGTINFDEKKVTLFFNENVMVTNISKEVIINPYYDLANFKAIAKGKKVDVYFKEELQSNTTYSINFGKAITDVNEKTPFSNYTYSFSTGSHIDTLSYSGIVLDNVSHLPLKDVTIGIYDKSTNRPDTLKPSYITSSEENSSFKFYNLPSKDFKVYGFNDLNKNKIVDPLNEIVGFLPDDINPSINKLDTIYLYTAKLENNKIKAPQSRENYLDINFSYGLKKINDLSVKRYHLVNNNNTLRIYPDKTDSTVTFRAMDSSGFVIDTNLAINYRPKPYTDTLLPLAEESITDLFELKNQLTLKLPHLYKTLNREMIYIINNQDTVQIDATQIELVHNPLSDNISFSSDNQTDTINILIKETAIQFQTGQYNKTFNLARAPLNKDNFGSLAGTIETSEPHYVLYLLDEEKNIIHQETNPTLINYNYVAPGTYTVKILIDKNANNYYDKGTLNKQAERYYIYPKPIVVKKGWDMGNINISF